jgi:NAD(P)-dependent dehydrogenase (short-subunit alcohol dehydrogenase family)
MSSAKRVALVTGGSRGIGLGIAKRLARDGFHVVINGRRPTADEAVSDVGHNCLYVSADIGNGDSRAAMLDTIRERCGRLDVLVNNAGIAPDVRADLLEASEESFDKLIGVNLKGPYFLTQAVGRWMKEQYEADGERRSVVFVTSISASVASVNRGDYCLSKAGLAMATKLWAARLAEFGIGVFEVRPGVIKTDMTGGVVEKYDALFAQGLAVEPRWGTPDDVAKAVAALCGDITYATGSVLHVDGGLTLQRL